MTLPSAEEFMRIAAQRLTGIHEASARGDSSVQRFYRGAVVLLTGGAGFLGKQIVEKLLRTCDVKKLYLLLRCPRGKTGDQRLEDMLANPVFESVRAMRPGFAEKIQVIAGDVAHTKLGLPDDIWQELTETVTVVLHCAATISFVDPLRKATATNVKGTFEMLNFGHACRNLRAFVHVSTAYCQAVRSQQLAELPEQFPTSPISPTTLMEIAIENPEGDSTQLEEINYKNKRTLDELCAKYIGTEYPNTYVFTKAVSEEAVRTMSAGLPICIIRPTIVISSYTEPSPGWIDESQAFGATGHILNMLYGVTHTVLANSAAKIDFIPVDIVSNAMLAAAWDTDRRWRRDEKEIMIYNVSSSNRNHITWERMFSVLFTEVRQHLSPKAVWYAFVLRTADPRLYTVLTWLLHVLPAYVADAALLLTGKRPAFVKMYKRVSTMSEIFRYFNLNGWVFRDDNLLQLYRRMSPTDRQLFNIDITSVDMKELMVLWNIGMRKYILKEDLGGEALARKRQRIFKMLTFAIAPVYFYIMFKLFLFVIFIFYGLINV